MKIFIILFCIIVLISCSAPRKSMIDKQPLVTDYETVDKYIGPKKKLAIAQFKNATRFGKRRLGDNITGVLSTELAQTNRFILLERERVDKILEQVALSQAGLTEGTLEQIQLLDADFILTGEVTHYAVKTTGSSNILTQSKKQTAEVKADARIIDTRSGEIILSETGEGTAEKEFSKVLGMGTTGGYDESLELDAFRAAVKNMTINLIKALDQRPWMCDVVEIAEEGLYIDSGRQSNLKIGDSLDVYYRGDAVKNLSGTIIGYKEQLQGTGMITEFFGENGAIVRMEDETNLSLPLICRIHGTLTK
jgi:curli biogenesis system outer membrane secretion channel CsgG